MIINDNYEYMQIIQAIPRSWKTSINDLAENLNNLKIQDKHLIKSQQIYCVNRLNSKKIRIYLMWKT